MTRHRFLMSQAQRDYRGNAAGIQCDELPAAENKNKALGRAEGVS